MDFLKKCYFSNTNLQVRLKEKDISHVSWTILEFTGSDELLLFIASLA